MLNILSGLFDSNERQLKKVQPIITKINSFEESFSKLTDEQLREKTSEFRKILGVNLETSRSEFYELGDTSLKSRLENEKRKLEEILPEVFAVIREASKRATNHRHFDVQMLAGYFLFANKITELFTGEGKTLAANMPLYLYGLTGRGAHLVTVNDYLARRDAQWNGRILESLGLTVGVVNNGGQFKYITDQQAIELKGDEAKELIKERDQKAKKEGRLKYDHMNGVNLISCTKAEAYACDVVYGTNNEFGFDYLRDNMSYSRGDLVQGPLYFSIVDEADSILIDEARTPLIISSSANQSNQMYKDFANIVRKLDKERDYTVDEKSKAVSINDEGIDRVEKILNIPNVYENAQYAYHLENALKAKELYRLDQEYLVRDGEVLIVDEFTGRVLPGRRYSEGLHQAIEAKEGVEVKRESQTVATITLQNYFRLYKFLSGMTGTALTEAEEFAKIYNLDTIVIPTNRPIVREDSADIVYRTQEGKFRAIVNDIIEQNKKGQPVLVGTTSVEKSEIISDILSKEGVKHNVLNAKQHESEAKVVSTAGEKGSVTIATNMAGRGTDIALGEGVKELGGLYVIGSERHESRRIDNQLRGRSGRQGDPGKSRFYISFEDELMRLFGGENMKAIMGSVGMSDDLPVSLGILGRSIETAQKRVEAYNYDIRKNLVEYDDVLNQQREIIYSLRRKILSILDGVKVEVEDFKINSSDLQSIDVYGLLNDLTYFSILEENTWKLPSLSNFTPVSHPIFIWTLRKIVEDLRYVISSQLSDDSKIDNIEERKTVAHVKSILTDEIIDLVVRELGFKDQIEFFRSLDDNENNHWKEEQLLKLTVASFIYHIHTLGLVQASEIFKILILQTIDNFWTAHLDTMTDLREGISLRNFAQKNPLVEYKNEGFKLFDEMIANIDQGIVTRLFKVRIVKEEVVKGQAIHEELPSGTNSQKKDNRPGNVSKQQTVKKEMQKVGRNDPCPCGSGKKYKKCHFPLYG